MEKEITDKDFSSGNIWNSESMKGKDEIISSDTKQILYFNELGKRVPWNAKVPIRKDSKGRSYKKCTSCGKWLLLNQFKKSNNKRSHGGVIAMCNVCRSIKEWSTVDTDIYSGVPLTTHDKKLSQVRDEELLDKCNNIVQDKLVKPFEKELEKHLKVGDFSIESATPNEDFLRKKQIEKMLKSDATSADFVNSKVEKVLNIDKDKLSKEDEVAMKELEKEEFLKEFTNEELINELRRRNFKGTLKMEIEL